MTVSVPVRTLDNRAWSKGRPELSVLIPFFRDDPCALLETLGGEAAALGGRVEVVCLDDGTGDGALADRVAKAVLTLPCPARFVGLGANEGRAKGRNRLMANARARHLLFLDSDMAPDWPDFLRRYLDLIATEDPAVVFGGFTLKQTPRRPEHALHHAVTLRADCHDAATRQRQATKTVCASNLLVRREVFEAEAFDERFSGWGWEEVEWAIRASRRWPIRHVDNSASHIGLDTAPALLGKYEQSQANFAIMRAAHPEVVGAFPSYRVARVLARLPFRSLWRQAFKRIALAGSAPLPLRMAATKLFRAAVYAEVV